MITRRIAGAVPVAAALRLCLLVAMAAPVVCQDEAQPYFSLSSQRTFGTTEKPQISLSGYRVPAVQIRVYRVKDGVQFFQQMEDPHSFGSHPPRPAGKVTWIERIHNWKRGLRRNIRLTLREQFTESPRAHLEGAEREINTKEPSQNPATYYAEAPLLNKDQLVLTFVQPVTTKDRWNAETVGVPVKEKGVYLVEAVHHDLRAYTVLIVSDVVLITKTGTGHVLTYLADRATGEPVAGAEVAAVSRNADAVKAETDNNGLANLTLKSPGAEQDIRIVVKRGADYAVSDVASWNFTRQGRPWTGLLYTDRPVYRPGDTMHFRGILRMNATVGYEIPAGKKVSVQISDPDGKAIYQKTLTANSNGIIHDQMSTSRSATLGSYFIQVKAGENEMSGNFEIQEYKKPEYEVRVTADKPRVLEGDSVQATIDARYYFGEPVNGAKVKYSVFRSRYWFPLWYDADEEGDEGNDQGMYDDAAGEQVSQDEGKLDADGKLTVAVPTTVSDNKIDYRYRIEAAVTDQAGREISGTGWVIATYGNFVLDVEPDRYVLDPGKTATFKVQARDYDNKPVATRVHLELAKWGWRGRKAGEVKASTDVSTGVDGTADAQLSVPAEGGEFRILAASPSENGRTVEASTYAWSAGGGMDADWFYGSQKTTQVVPDKKTYHAGDTARILLVAGQPNTPILVTVEGRDIRSQQVLRSQGATATFEYTVTKDDEPGFFVSALFIRKGQMYQGQKRIVVPPDDHRLAVKLSTDKPQYLPGQSATYSIDVTSGDGKPVSGADLSLGVVDEAIYAIRKDETPDIVSFFYGREWDSVVTENSLTYFFSGEAGKRRMRLAELRSQSVLAQLKPERMVQPKIRKAFPDTAFWADDLTTDSAGHAQAKVAFPDSLTTWRATARGSGPSDTFGSATQKTIVRKNLILRVAAPRFFVQGDEVVISGIVHNYLTTAKHARVTVNLEGLAFANGTATQEVDVASRAEVKVDWRVKAQLVRHAKITAEALTDEESDAIEIELPVNPPGVPIRQASGGSLRDSGSANLAVTFPANAVPGSRSISIRLSPSVAGTIFSALEYLTSYPYGCVEQTMSSFLPDLVVTKTIGELGVKQPIDQDELHQKVQAGLDRLYSFHHEDGGWGWWVTDESHPFMTAYVVAGLSEARNDGIAVREDMISSGATWIERNLGSGDLEPDLRAYMEYALALAGHNDKAAMDASYSARSKLSPYGVALLGLAFELVKDARAAELAGQLERGAKQSELEAWWPATRDEMLDFSADVTPEASAYAMKLLTHERPKSPLLPKAELWLVNHRDEGYWWSSTKQTAMVIYGLIDYVKATNELHPNLTASVTVNGQHAASYTFQGDALGTSKELMLEDAQVQSSANQIQVSASGTGTLFYSVSGIHYSDEAREEKRGAIALNVLRDYFRLVPNKEGGEITYDLKPLDGPVSQGDTVAVRLTVTGSDWRYFMAEDPIPAGTEFIEKDALYHIREKPPWWRYWFTRRELHDDRMAIFQTHFTEGQQQYFYLLKVVNPGMFHASPARVGPMYQPGVLATTESKTLEVR